MQILLGCRDLAELELLSIYLAAGDNGLTATACRDEFSTFLKGETPFDVALIPVDWPDVEQGFESFQQLRKSRPDCPVVATCQTSDVMRVVRFMTHGLHTYIPRDAAGDYVFMLLTLLEQVVESARAQREQRLAEKLREELDAVRKVQAAMIPSELTAPPGYRIAARYEPSQLQVCEGRHVTMAGGDYYDVFPLGKNYLVMLIGDASGHGLKAAMSIMVMHTLVRMIRGHRFRQTQHYVQEINRQLCEHAIVNDGGGFITLLYAILDLRTNILQWTSAGHPVPFVQNLKTGRIAPLGPESESSGPPLALFSDATYTSQRCLLPAECRLLLYTDGLVEAHGPKTHERVQAPLFGMERVSAILSKGASQSIEATIDELFVESNAFTEGAGRHDDTSVVVIERSQTSAKPLIAHLLNRMRRGKVHTDLS